MPISEVYNMDCMEYIKDIPDKFFDLAIVDPPYGLNVANMAYTREENRPCRQKNGNSIIIRRGKYTNKDWDKNTPSKDYFDNLFRVSKNQIIWGINYMPIHLTGGRIIWDKCNGDNDFSDCEIAYCSHHETIKLFRFMWAGMMQGKSSKDGHVQQGNKKLNEKRIHPTQKPVILYKWLLEKYANPEGKILDTHLGSGSSRIAAYKLGFDFYATEIDKEYFDAQEERFRRECFGEEKLSNGQVAKQLSIFDL